MHQKTLQMMNWQELNISTEIIESIKSKTDFTVPSRSLEIVKEILEYFATLKVELSKESLLNGDYLKLSPDEKDKLLVHFYWMHNRNKKTNESDFVSLNKIHEHLNIEPNYVNRFFRQYSYTHLMQCPSCGSLVDVNFKNLRANQIIATECHTCKHILDEVIYAKCTCKICMQLIFDVESYVNKLSENIENKVKELAAEPWDIEESELSEQKLKWFAD